MHAYTYKLDTGSEIATFGTLHLALGFLNSRSYQVNQCLTCLYQGVHAHVLFS